MVEYISKPVVYQPCSMSAHRTRIWVHSIEIRRCVFCGLMSPGGVISVVVRVEADFLSVIQHVMRKIQTLSDPPWTWPPLAPSGADIHTLL